MITDEALPRKIGVFVLEKLVKGIGHKTVCNYFDILLVSIAFSESTIF